MVKLVDTPDSKSGFFGSAGSIPALGTIGESKKDRINTKARKLSNLAGFFMPTTFRASPKKSIDNQALLTVHLAVHFFISSKYTVIYRHKSRKATG